MEQMLQHDAKPAASKLVFDQVATDVGDAEVVTISGYVSKEKSRDGVVGVVTNSWFSGWLEIPREAIRSQIPGSQRPDGRSVLWVLRDAPVTLRTETTATAFDYTQLERAAQALPPTGADGGGVSPPPGDHPK